MLRFTKEEFKDFPQYFFAEETIYGVEYTVFQEAVEETLLEFGEEGDFGTYFTDEEGNIYLKVGESWNAEVLKYDGEKLEMFS